MKKNIFFFFYLSLLLLVAFLITCTKNKDNNSNSPVYPSDCAHQLAGEYTGNDYCSSSGQTAYPCTILAIDSADITFSNLGGAAVNAKLDCNKNTITIPTQTFPGNFSISGNGTYTANRIIITWSGLSLGTPVNCSTTYTR